MADEVQVRSRVDDSEDLADEVFAEDHYFVLLFFVVGCDEVDDALD